LKRALTAPISNSVLFFTLSSMTPKTPPDNNSTLTGAASPEELEAAQAANQADAQSALKAELDALKIKNVELADNYLRAKAEAENARRRADDEISKARKFAVESFAESLLPVTDSLEAGLLLKDASAQQIREGTEASLQQLKSALERNRVMAIDPAAGTKFDPHQHQAISMVPLPAGSAQEANTVVSVLQKGYLIADRVLRPALVTVAAPQ
jgi:molecular chaperone GrpE